MYDYCATENSEYRYFIRHIRNEHRDLYLALQPERASNRPVMVEQEDQFEQGIENDNLDTFDPIDNEPIYEDQIDDNSVFEPFQEGQALNARRQLNENDQRVLNQYASGLYNQALVQKLVTRTAEFAMNLKGQSKVADKTANFLALNWCQHMLFVFDELLGLPDHVHETLKDVIKAASSTDKQRRLVRLPITMTHIQPPHDARPYIYISILDTLRELFKRPEVAELIDQDYLSKFSFIFHIYFYIYFHENIYAYIY